MTGGAADADSKVSLITSTKSAFSLVRPPNWEPLVIPISEYTSTGGKLSLVKSGPRWGRQFSGSNDVVSVC